MKVICFVSDYDSCFFYRVQMPFSELKKYDVSYAAYCFFPTSNKQFDDLVEIIKEFDLVIVQRCYILASVQVVKAACEYLGKSLIFETDDDYLSLDESNPAYYAIARDQSIYHKFKAAAPEEKEKLLPQLEESRMNGIRDYAQILKMADHITVTNEVLARTIYPFNKNVKVFQNNIDRLFPWRDSVDLKTLMGEDGCSFEVPSVMGFYIVPDHATVSCKLGKVDKFDVKATERRNFVRIGYTTSPSRKGKDWETIRATLSNWSEKTKHNHLIVFIEDHAAKDGPYFFNSMKKKDVCISIPQTPYDKYMQNYRNMDIALAPLEPTCFNTSRSEIKLLEAAAWKIPGLVPRLSTYGRSFIDGVNCLMYSNANEFEKQLERLVTNRSLREELGNNAYKYVSENRMESQHAAARYDFYKQCIEEKKPLRKLTCNMK